jgi:hypothetical protein
MRMVKIGHNFRAVLAATSATLLLTGCGGGSAMNHDRPDEFAVTRSQPLVIPPDFALVPPKAGDPTPQGTDARTQALDALFGGPAPRSRAEQNMLSAAGSDRAAVGARSVAGDPETNVVDKGAVTQTIVAAPPGAGREATASTGGTSPPPLPVTPQ